jgi:hypothetical protein
MRAIRELSTGLAVAAATALFLAGCGGLTPAATDHVEYLMDYPQYSSVKQMGDEATLVVEATLGTKPRVEKMFPTDISGETDPKINPEAGAPEPGLNGEDREGMVITVHSATITRVHKGSAKPGEVIEVKQLGGTLDGTTYELENGVPFRDGAKYLLFLVTYPDSPASLLNPQQAQYAVDVNGTFRPLGGNQLAVTNADLVALSAK